MFIFNFDNPDMQFRETVPHHSRLSTPDYTFRTTVVSFCLRVCLDLTDVDSKPLFSLHDIPGAHASIKTFL